MDRQTEAHLEELSSQCSRRSEAEAQAAACASFLGSETSRCCRSDCSHCGCEKRLLREELSGLFVHFVTSLCWLFSSSVPSLTSSVSLWSLQWGVPQGSPALLMTRMAFPSLGLCIWWPPECLCPGVTEAPFSSTRNLPRLPANLRLPTAPSVQHGPTVSCAAGGLGSCSL